MKIYSSSKLAETLGVSPICIYQWRAKGLPYVRHAPRILEYDLEEVIRWMLSTGETRKKNLIKKMLKRRGENGSN